MAKAETTELAVVGASDVPAHLQHLVGTNEYKSTGSEDILIPIITLAQGTTEAVKNKEVDDGVWFNNVTGEVYGEEVEGVVLKSWSEVILWNPLVSGGGILARSKDCVKWDGDAADKTFDVKIGQGSVTKMVQWSTGKDVQSSGLCEFGSEDPENPDSPPAATRHQNFLMWLPKYQEAGIGIVRFQRSSKSVGKRLNTMLAMSSLPSHTRLVRLGVTVDKNAEGNVYNKPTVTSAGFISEDDLDVAESMVGKWADQSVVAQETAPPSTDEVSTEGAEEVGY